MFEDSIQGVTQFRSSFGSNATKPSSLLSSMFALAETFPTVHACKDFTATLSALTKMFGAKRHQARTMRAGQGPLFGGTALMCSQIIACL